MELMLRRRGEMAMCVGFRARSVKAAMAFACGKRDRDQPLCDAVERGNPFGERGNPLGERRNPFGERGNPLGERRRRPFRPVSG